VGKFVFATMEKEQYRSVIRFLFLDGKMCEEISEVAYRLQGSCTFDDYKKRNRIIDRYCSFSIVANKYKLAHFQQLSKQNYSINLSEILTDDVRKMALNDGIQILSQWCYQSLNTGTYHTALVCVCTHIHIHMCVYVCVCVLIN